jgi:hypothetical protein
MLLLRCFIPAIGFICLITLLSGCVAGPTRALFCSNNDTISYVTTDKVPLRIDISGSNCSNWKYQSKKSAKHVILKTDSSPKRMINIFEYNDGIIKPRFYKSDFTEEQAIEQYQHSESWFHISNGKASKSEILSKNIEGPIIPNMFWSINWKDARSPTYFITMSKNKHLIMISLQEIDPPYSDGQKLLAIFRSIRLLTEEQAYEVLRTEAGLNVRK